MNTITDLYRKRQAASLASCAPQAPACLTCGMLECVCRPRFFAGQVLQADDLNRLDSYIRAKNRLHNRQLNGWGVVNGLEVTCNPCGDGVTVSCGYALSPCGEDIVVCDAVTVDICDLIRRCKDSEHQMYPCDPPSPYGAAGQGCDAVEEDWILAIRYSESPARGVKPLYSTAATSCGCSTTSKPSSGGCGCGSGGSSSNSSCSCGGSTKPRAAPVQCEPTVICEGFSFEVYRAPKPQTVTNPQTGAVTVVDTTPQITQRFQCCTETLTNNAPQKPQGTPATNPSGWYLWGLQFKEHLQKHYQTKAGYNCDLLAKLNALAIPDPKTNLQGFVDAEQVLAVVYVDALIACLCSALLPPCPMPTNDVRVPLALLHVNANPCRVMRVCNWTTYRKFATTFPSLQYWLSALPFGRNLRELLQKMCCFDLALPKPNPQVPNVAGVAQPFAFASATASAPPDNELNERMTLRLNPTVTNAAPIHDTSALLVNTLFAQRDTLTAESFLSSLVGGGQGLSTLQSGNLPQFLLMNQLLKPLTDATGAGSVSKLMTAGLFSSKTAGSEDLTAMRRELAALKQEVEKLKSTRRGKK